MTQTSHIWRWLGVLAGLIILIGSVIHILSKKTLPPIPTDHVVIATPAFLYAGPIFTALEKDFFRENGLDVTYQPHNLGVQALQSVLSDKAEIAIAADIPFMFAVMHGERIAIFATLYKSRRDLALMALTDRGIATPKDLAGKTIGTSFGTNLQFFLDTMLLANDVPEEKISVINIKPPEFSSALQSGKIDAVVTFSPYTEEMQALFGKRAVTFFGEDLHTSRYNLIAKQDYLAKHPDTARKILETLTISIQYIANNPVQTQEIISKYLHLNIHQIAIAEIMKAGEFKLALDQSLLLTLDDETRWAMKHNLVKTGPMPNYLDYLNLDPLLSLNPNAVEIIY
ncbi:MAG: NrtA/SsuA/CpmA family ABC transporter substrate-binding protein [Pseudomonadota bacterium]